MYPLLTQVVLNVMYLEMAACAINFGLGCPASLISVYNFLVSGPSPDSSNGLFLLASEGLKIYKNQDTNLSFTFSTITVSSCCQLSCYLQGRQRL